jgi:hypothetical protein
LVERSYNNGFQLLYTLPPSWSTVWESLSTGKTLLTPSRLVDSLFPGVAELSEISWSIGQFSCVGFGGSRMWDTFALISSVARLYFHRAVVDRWPVLLMISCSSTFWLYNWVVQVCFPLMFVFYILRDLRNC